MTPSIDCYKLGGAVPKRWPSVGSKIMSSSRGASDFGMGTYLSYSLNSLKGGYIGNYIRDYYRAY